MFDCDPVARAAINSHRVAIAAGDLATVLLLVEKGIFSRQEYERALARATAMVDQEHAADMSRAGYDGGADAG